RGPVPRGGRISGSSLERIPRKRAGQGLGPTGVDEEVSGPACGESRLYASRISPQDRRGPRRASRPIATPGPLGHRPPFGISVGIGADHFTVGFGAEAPPDVARDGIFHEPHATVDEQRIHAAGVHAGGGERIAAVVALTRVALAPADVEGVELVVG